MSMEAVLRGAEVVDGTAAPARRVDVAIAGGRIVGVGPGLASDLPEVDLSGLVLTPGFIDPHTHYDAQVFWDPDLTPSSWHGVTTIVAGNCGFSVAPTRPAHREIIVRTLEQVEGMSVAALEAGLDWNFESFPEYLRAVDQIDKRLNVACMIGHTTLRWFVMGEDATERHATDDELTRMRQLVGEALECGAVGFSSSRHNHVGAYGKPVPSRASTRQEMLDIASAMNEARRGTFQLALGPTFGIDDAVELSRRSGGPVTWSGVELVPMAGQQGRQPAADAVRRSDVAGTRVYPQFPSRPVVDQITLRDPFPLRAASPGFLEAIAAEPEARPALYSDPDWRRRTRDGIVPLWNQRLAAATVQETTVHAGLRNGPTLGELAAARRITPFDVLLDLSLADDLATRFRVAVANTDTLVTEDLLRDPRCLLGLSDAGAHITQLCDADYATHLLGYWVREQRAISLEMAVWRLTGQPAAVYGLADRGRIAVGAAADLVAFDAASIGGGPVERVWDFPGGADRLVVPSTGIERVWVNGTAIRAAGHDVAGAAPGRLLSGSSR